MPTSIIIISSPSILLRIALLPSLLLVGGKRVPPLCLASNRALYQARKERCICQADISADEVLRTP